MPINTFTQSTLPSENATFIADMQQFLSDEDALRFQDIFTPFVASGGTHATVGSLTATPDALLAYPGGYYIVETSAITYNDDKTNIWVICHKDKVSAVATWTRVAGTHYLFEDASASQPTIPADSILLMRVVTASGSITVVEDRRILAPNTKLWSLTTADRDLLETTVLTVPTMVYNSTTNKINFWDGTAWRAVTST